MSRKESTDAIGAVNSLVDGWRSSGKTIAWRTLAPLIRPCYEAYGPAVVSEIFGLPLHNLTTSAKYSGLIYQGPRLGPHDAEGKDARVALARKWLADGADMSNIPRVPFVKAASGFIKHTKAPKAVAVVVPDGVRVTVAPAFVDRRWAPDPGYIGPFTRAGVGNDVRTGEAWR